MTGTSFTALLGTSVQTFVASETVPGVSTFILFSGIFMVLRTTSFLSGNGTVRRKFPFISTMITTLFIPFYGTRFPVPRSSIIIFTSTLSVTV